MKETPERNSVKQTGFEDRVSAFYHAKWIKRLIGRRNSSAALNPSLKSPPSILVLLSTLVVIGSSLPSPDEYKIPDVGTGRRSQYYVLHSDGTFKYGFDTGDGAFESVMSKTPGETGGQFGYIDPDGRSIKLEYEAGLGGFVARGDHLPKPSSELASALAAVVRSAQPYVDPLADSDTDRSYDFRFQSDDHSRNEKSDSDGTVTGSYSYIDENGITRSFTYRAGKGIGFVIEGDGLTQEIPQTRTSFRQSNLKPRVRPNVQPPSLRTSSRTRIHSNSQSSNFRQSNRVVNPPSNVHSTRSRTPGDASYSFSYNAGDHSRSEKSDSGLNVDGEFSFVADDGQKRTLNYVAGSSTGFQAQGDHLPKAPEPDFGSRTSSSRGNQHLSLTRNQHSSAHKRPQFRHSAKPTSSGQRFQSNRSQVSRVTPAKPVPTAYTPPVSTRTSHTQSLRKPSTFNTRTRQGQTSRKQSDFRSSHSSGNYEDANIRSSISPAGEYSFDYRTSSHFRSEKGDNDNNVDGKFGFTSEDDGIQREIEYEAGRDTGFIAEGDHIPVGPIVPGAPRGQPTGRFVKTRSDTFVDPLADSDTDASYKFGFDSDTYSRSETADEDGNVVGTYSVVEEDGTRITYRFRAGRGIGFETEEISRTKGPRPVKPAQYKGPLAGDYQHISSQPSFRQSHGQQSFRVGSTSSKQHPHTTHQTEIRKHKPTPVHSHRTTTGHRSSSQQVQQNKHTSQSQFSHSGSLSRGNTQRKTPRPSTYYRQKVNTQRHSSTPRLHSNIQRTKQTPFLRSSLKPTHSEQVFPGFTLNRYEPSPTAEKFGYVLRFN